jgi:hypothetical protein
LKLNGVDTVLVGGAVVSIYSEGAYQSGDLDFVLCSIFKKKNLPKLLKEIGFTQSGRHFVHSNCQHLYIEFSSSFLEIGDDNNIVPAEVESSGTMIKILTPTDCVKDRLASYFPFEARECLDQAVLVTGKHPINMQAVKKWCLNEGAEKTFDDFQDKLP